MTGKVTLKHPFTMLVCGATSCGKSTFLKRLLEKRLISPWPRRLIWLYKRWQPLYDEIKHIVPTVEFIQGIPMGLEQDIFFQYPTAKYDRSG
jgi:septin family protein